MHEYWTNATTAFTSIAESFEDLISTLFTPVNTILFSWADGADLPEFAITALNWITSAIPSNLTLIGFMLGTGVLTWLVLSIIKWVIGIVM